MRLLLTLDQWSVIGGSERFAGAAAESLRDRGHDVLVLCARAGSPSPAPSVPHESHPAYGDRHAPPGDLAALSSRARAFAPDAILALSAANPRAFEALLEVAPVVRFIQDHTPFCPGLNKLHVDGRVCTQPQGLACLERYFLGDGCHGFRRGRPAAGLDALGALRKHLRELSVSARAARLLVASEYMRRELLAAGVDPARVARVPYFTLSGTRALPATPPDARTRAFLEAETTPLVLAPARLALPDKGVDHLLTALTKLRTPFRAVIAGEGPAGEWLRAKSAAEGLAQRVHFAGWQSPGALESLYAAADVVAFPSVWNEPFGLVGLEAMAHARPVVAFDVGGVGEWLVDDETGRLATPRDSDALAAALDELLADPSRATALGLRGRRRAQQLFSRKTGVEQLERELERAGRGAVRRSRAA